MDERECRSQAARIGTLVQEVAAFPEPSARAKMEELLRALLEMYGAGLTRMVEMAAQTDTAGKTLLETFARDELVSSLLLLHGLHPVGLEERVRQAVEKVQSTVQTRGGTLALIRVENGAASLRLVGNCQGCGASLQALKQTVEDAIYGAAPDLEELHFAEDTAPKSVGIPVKFIPPRKTKANEPTDTQLASDKSQASVSRTR